MLNAPLGSLLPHNLVRDSQVFEGATASLVPLTVKAASGQSTDVFKVVNSSGTTLFSVDQDGDAYFLGTVTKLDTTTATSLALSGNLSVSGTSTLSGAVSLSSTLAVTGASTFTGAITAGNVNVHNNLIVSGALTVMSESSLEGQVTIDVTDTEALLVRKNADGGDVFLVDTTNSDVQSATITPLTSDGSALGTTSLMWSDLFLASGGVINWNNGDATITHSSHLLTVGAADIAQSNGYGLVIGHSALIAAADVTAEVQVLGTAAADSSIVLGLWSETDALEPTFRFLKSGHASIGASNKTSVADDEILGSIQWYPADGTDLATLAASFGAEVDDASPAAGDIGIAFVWRGMPGGGGAIADVLRLSAAGDLSPGASDQGGLGTGSLMWGDLFLASGGVINFNNGDVTLTHAANSLTLAGGGFTHTIGATESFHLDGSTTRTGTTEVLDIDATIDTTTATADVPAVTIDASRASGDTGGTYCLQGVLETGNMANGEWSYVFGGTYNTSNCATSTSNAAVFYAGSSTTDAECNDYGIYIASGYDTAGYFDGPITVTGAITVGDISISDATPILNFYDTDCGDGDLSASILVDATATGTGAENVDMTFMQQIGGTATDFLIADADGYIQFQRAIVPTANDGAALGVAATGEWSDLFLASGGVINWANGGATITHSTNLLTVGSASVAVADSYGIVVGHSALLTVAGGTSSLQVLGTTVDDGSLTLGVWSETDTVSPALKFFKSGHATVSASNLTSVADDEIVGSINFYPADGTQSSTLAAQIVAEVDDATPAAGDVGMAFVWRAMPGGGGAIADVMRMSAAGDLTPGVSDQGGLGTASLMWGDLFLASGAVVNWNNGDITLTHAAGKLTFGGDGTVEIDFGSHEMTNVDIDSGTIDDITVLSLAAGANRTISVATDNTEGDQLTVVAGAGGTGDVAGGALNLTGGAAGSGGNNVGGAVYVAGGVDGGTSTGGAVYIRGGAGDTNGTVYIGDSNTASLSIGVSVALAANDITLTGSIGRDADNELNWGTDDSLAIVITGTTHNIVSISDGAGDNDKLVTQGYVDDAIATVDTWAEVLALGNTSGGTDVIVSDSDGLVVGHTALLTICGGTSELQVLGTAGDDSTLSLGCWSSTDTVHAALKFWKSADATISASNFTALADDEIVGAIEFYPADGAQTSTLAAAIVAEVDDATPASGDVGMAFVFRQMPGGGGAIADSLRLSAAGDLAPGVSDQGGLGTSSLMWGDLFLASGGVINFDNGDVTVTHSANALAFAGATSGYSFDELVNIAASKKLQFGGVDILVDSAGSMTLSNIDAIDATTETTLEAAIDALSNLVTVGTITSGVWNAGAVTSSGDVTGTCFLATGDTSASDSAAVGYTATEGLILTGQGSSYDITIKNDADGTVLTVATGTTNVDVVGDLQAACFIPDGDTSAGDSAAVGYTATEGLILTGQGSSYDVTIKNDADAVVLSVATGGTSVDIVGDVTAATLNADGDTSAGDNAAIGYTATEGIIVTGQGSTNDVTVKNDADAQVLAIPTGTANVQFGVDGTVGRFILAEKCSIDLDGSFGADGDYTGMTVEGTAGATLAFGDLVYLDPDDSRWELTDADAAAGANGDARGLLGICVLAAAGDGSATRILLQGIVRADAAFPALTVNEPVYVDDATAGDITLTPPSDTDDVVRTVGFCIDGNTIYFNPSSDYITAA